MVSFVYTVREMLGVASLQALKARHTKHVAERQQIGMRTATHVDPTPKAARINHNRWLFDCVCGAGVACEPAWDEACCFGCGAVYPNVQFPAPAVRLALEAELVRRPGPETRSWLPNETLADLVRENIERGVR